MKCLFSACLLGVRCRYDAASNENDRILETWNKEGGLVICPEQLGGMATPRKPSTLQGGDGADVLDGKAALVNDAGQDVTESFLRGAMEAGRLARLAGVEVAYLKAGSPSCGCNRTNIAWQRSPGCGVTAALLARSGIRIVEIE
ncbi:MAG: DUF523 domain-containing protein [Pseudomonadota bacterium]